MSSKEQKTPNEQVSEEMEQHAHHDDTLPEAAEGVDLRDAESVAGQSLCSRRR